MPIKIAFELSDEELESFAALARGSRETFDASEDADKIIAATKELLAEVKDGNVPEYIANRLIRLELLVDMIADEEWKLPEEDTRRVINAMTYFAESEDLIADNIPVIGFLDDAIMVDCVYKELEAEAVAYMQFCAFRRMEEQRLEKAGLSTAVDREKRLANRRDELHSQMKEKRQSPLAAGAWRVSR